jgi:hypothetical protein
MSQYSVETGPPAGREATYENFPPCLVAVANALPIAIYAAGTYVMAHFGIAAAALYLLYCALMEFRVLAISCRRCYYFGKVCAFGKGKISAWIFKQRDPRPFEEKSISWKDLVPDFLTSILPLLAGGVLLLRQFSWLTLAVLVLLLVLSSAGNAAVRGGFACKHCRQRELGCPAERLFNKGKRASPQS